MREKSASIIELFKNEIPAGFVIISSGESKTPILVPPLPNDFALKSTSRVPVCADVKETTVNTKNDNRINNFILFS
jgi:hypothetical protein